MNNCPVLVKAEDQRFKYCINITFWKYLINAFPQFILDEFYIIFILEENMSKFQGFSK